MTSLPPGCLCLLHCDKAEPGLLITTHPRSPRVAKPPYQFKATMHKNLGILNPVPRRSCPRSGDSYILTDWLKSCKASRRLTTFVIPCLRVEHQISRTCRGAGSSHLKFPRLPRSGSISQCQCSVMQYYFETPQSSFSPFPRSAVAQMMGVTCRESATQPPAASL